MDPIFWFNLTNRFFFKQLLLATSLAAFLLFASAGVQAQDTGAPSDRSLEDVPVNYTFAEVLGTGFYNLENRKIVVVRIPFSLRFGESPDEKRYWRMLLPFSVGYENINDDNNFEKWIPSQVVTLSLVPGVEYVYTAKKYTFKPFVRIGLGRDFDQYENTGIAVAGMRLLGKLYETDRWNLRTGTSLRWAGEEMFSKAQYTRFSLYELGVDLQDKKTRRWFGTDINIGVYLLWQHFFNQRNASHPLIKPVDIDNLYQLGFSMELQQPMNILGAELKTVSVGLSLGDDGNAITFGTGFPF